MVPGPMQFKDHSVETNLGKIDVFNFFYSVEDTISDNQLYMVTTYTFPDSSIQWSEQSTLDSLFADNVQKSQDDLQAILLYENMEKENGVFTKTWKLQYNNGVAKFKCFFIEDQYYLLQVYSYKERSLNTSVNRFMQSFRRLD
jgi:hypothetical protein